MRIEELLRAMFFAFFVILTCSVISMYIFCLIFRPDASFSLDDIREIFTVTLASDLTFIVFYARKELSKLQMTVRCVIHVPIVLGVLLYFAHIFDWVNMDSPKEIAVFTLLVLGVYTVVFTVTSYRDKKTAEKLNDGLKRRYQ